MNITEKINWLLIALNAIGALVIFLFGVANMSDGLKAIGSDKRKR